MMLVKTANYREFNPAWAYAEGLVSINVMADDVTGEEWISVTSNDPSIGADELLAVSRWVDLVEQGEIAL